MIAEIALSIMSVLPQCRHEHGRFYIICEETGGNPAKYIHGEYHNRKKGTAKGLYGMTDGTERDYGTVYNYMLKRYGSWNAAERFHRRHNWW